MRHRLGRYAFVLVQRWHNAGGRRYTVKRHTTSYKPSGAYVDACRNLLACSDAAQGLGPLLRVESGFLGLIRLWQALGKAPQGLVSLCKPLHGQFVCRDARADLAGSG